MTLRKKDMSLSQVLILEVPLACKMGEKMFCSKLGSKKIIKFLNGETLQHGNLTLLSMQ